MLIETMSIDKNSNINMIFEGHIFRDSSSRLIVPDDIYDALLKLKCNTSYEFAMQVTKLHLDNAGDYNYYASWFILVKHDGGLKKCIKASKVKGANDSDSINKMIEEHKIVLYQVQINSAEEVFESKLKNPVPEGEDNKEEYNSYSEKEIKSIEKELGEILSCIDIKTEGDYNDLKYKLSELKDRNYYVYSKSLGYSYGNSDITQDAEKKYNVLLAKIDSVSGKLEIMHDEKLGTGIKSNKDYYTFSDEKYPVLINAKLKDIIGDINEYTEKDYSNIKRSFKELYDEVYSIYQLVLSSATEMDCLTKILLNEAINKYKKVIAIIGNEEARLEHMHDQNKPAFGSLIKKIINKENK